jgi:hypothetical protein
LLAAVWMVRERVIDHGGERAVDRVVAGEGADSLRE